MNYKSEFETEENEWRKMKVVVMMETMMRQEDEDEERKYTEKGGEQGREKGS